jgi:hypothetical protein
MEEKHYTVFVHTDESENATAYGSYTWEEAGKRTEELLKEFPSVSWGGTRFYRPATPNCTEEEN